MRVCREVRKGFLEKRTLKLTLMDRKEFSRQRNGMGDSLRSPGECRRRKGGAGSAEVASGGNMEDHIEL